MTLQNVVGLAIIVTFVNSPSLCGQEPDKDCGVRCMFVGLHAADEQCGISLAEIRKKLAPGDTGNTMQQLSDLATSAGFQALTLQTSLDAIRMRERPFACIAHLKSGHFVLLADVSEETVDVLDPPRRRKPVPSTTFTSVWSGNVLLISKSPLESEDMINGKLMWLTWQKRLFLVFKLMASGFAAYLMIRALRGSAFVARLRSRFAICLITSMAVVSSAAGCGDTVPPPGRTGVEQIPSAEKHVKGDILVAGEESANDDVALKVTPPYVDFGKVQLNQKDLKAIITLENCSGETLKLTEIKTSCGCTAAVPQETMLLPGKSTTMEVQVKALDAGRQSSKVQIVTDPPYAFTTLEIQWEAGRRINFFPRDVLPGTIFIGEESETQITIEPPDGIDPRTSILKVKAMPETVVTATLEHKENQTLLRVKVRPEFPDLQGRGAIVVDCADPFGVLRIPVAWSAVELIDCEPKSVFRGKVSAKAPWEAKCVVRSRKGQASKVSLSDEVTTVSFTAVETSEGRVACTLSGHAPDARGPFTIKVPLDIVSSETKQQIVFSVSGIVEDSAPNTTE